VGLLLFLPGTYAVSEDRMKVYNLVDSSQIAAKVKIAYIMEDRSMKSTTVTVSKRGYIVLPARIRKEMEIRKGMRMLLSRKDDTIILQPVSSFTNKLAGLTAKSIGKTPQEVQDYVDGERADR
jgi:AbrB family looped-hinge helix DNA binding protein